jgi:hypothetical protein
MIFLNLLFFIFSNTFICGGVLPDNSYSASARGRTVLNILYSPVSPFFMSVGGSGLSNITPDNVFYNPGSVANSIYKNSYYLDFQKINVDAKRSDFYYLNMDVDKTVKGFYLSYIDYGEFLKTDEYGNISGSFSPSDYILNFHYSIGQRDRVGFNVKYVYSDLVYTNIKALLFDLGFNLSSKKVKYAFAIRNLGFIKDHTPPLEFDIGIKYLYSEKLSGFFDYKIPSSNSPYPTGGFEYLFANYDDIKLKLRGGFNYRNKSYLGWGSTFSGGIGFEIGSFSIDYAFVPYSDLDYTHFIAIKFLYGKPSEEKNYKKEFKDFMMKQMSLKKRIAVLGFLGDDIDYGKLISNSLEEILISNKYSVITSIDPIYLSIVKGVPINENEAISIAKKLGLDFAVYGSYEKSSSDTIKIKMYFIDVSLNKAKVFEMISNLYDIRNIVLKLSDEISKNIY